MKLAAMRKLQLLDISLSAANKRCIFVAEIVNVTSHVPCLSAANTASEIVGCCEVAEEQLDILMSPTSTITRSERERRKTARHRAIVENLCVGQQYRRSGVGMALVHACERAVQCWPGHDEIFAQVKQDSMQAYHLFLKRGYRCLFADPTCKEVTLENAMFAKEVVVTKLMLRKFL